MLKVYGVGWEIFSSPEPEAPGELIGWEASIVRPSSAHTFKRFLSKTTGQNAAKFHTKHPGTGKTKNS